MQYQIHGINHHTTIYFEPDAPTAPKWQKMCYCSFKLHLHVHEPTCHAFFNVIYA